MDSLNLTNYDSLKYVKLTFRDECPKAIYILKVAYSDRVQEVKVIKD